MSLPVLGPAELALKASAPFPTCLCVDTPDAGDPILVHALKDLHNAGIPARLIVAGRGTHEREPQIRQLAEGLGINDSIHVVHDANGFTLSRVYLFSQYVLAAAAHDVSELMRAAVTNGCIPIRYQGRYGAFFNDLERIIRATYNNPDGYAAMHKKTAAALLT